MEDNQTNTTLHRELMQLRNVIARIESAGETAIQDRLIPKKRAASLLGICYRTLERWCSIGYINRVVIGGRIFIHQREIDRIIDLGLDVKSFNSQPQLLEDIVSKYAK